MRDPPKRDNCVRSDACWSSHGAKQRDVSRAVHAFPRHRFARWLGKFAVAYPGPLVHEGFDGLFPVGTARFHHGFECRSDESGAVAHRQRRTRSNEHLVDRRLVGASLHACKGRRNQRSRPTADSLSNRGHNQPHRRIVDSHRTGSTQPPSPRSAASSDSNTSVHPKLSRQARLSTDPFAIGEF